MRRLDFMKSFVKGGVLISTGLALGGKIRILSKRTKDADARYEDGKLIEEPGRVISGEIQFCVHAYKNMTEAKFKELWEEEMDMLKESAWTAVRDERNKLLAGVYDAKA